MKKKRSQKEDIRVKMGLGSVYEQLGYKDHKEMETKATLVMEITKAIKKKKFTQTKAAEILGVSQPKLSSLLNGHFRGYSVERLMHFLIELGKDVDIIVSSKPSNRKARVSVSYSNIAVAAKGRY